MSFSFNGNTPRKIIFNNQDVKKLIFNNNIVWQKSGLPSEYEELEYIESTGTQYINTGVNASEYPNFKSMIKGQFMDTSTSQYLGCFKGGSLYLFLMAVHSGNFLIQVGAGGREKRIREADTEIHDFVVDIANSSAHIDDSSVQLNNVSVVDGEIALFARLDINRSIVSSWCKLRIYKCEFYNGETLISDFIPCYRKSDNVAGLYDKVTNTFYINSGRGEFIKGYK